MTEKVWVVVSTEYVFGEPSTPDIDVFATKGQANTFATAVGVRCNREGSQMRITAP
jgi:hypothetical protein